MAPELCRARGDERHRPLPGDECVPQHLGVMTHAITINASPEAVWPWLVQLGSGRAGWYAYDRIDNGGRPSACPWAVLSSAVGVAALVRYGRGTPRPGRGTGAAVIHERHPVNGVPEPQP